MLKQRVEIIANIGFPGGYGYLQKPPNLKIWLCDNSKGYRLVTSYVSYTKSWRLW